MTVLINRPAKMNALNKETIAELVSSLEKAFADTAVRAVLLSGSGEKAFVAGADISELSGLNEVQAEELARNAHSGLFDLIENSPKPVLAAINGYALGGGLELALACHLRIASSSAKMGLPELSLGLIPGYGGTQRLTSLIGRAKAMEFILQGTQVTAAEALQTGLVNQVTEPAELIPAAINMLTKIIRKSPLAIAAAIKSINAAGGPVKSGFEIEIAEFSRLFSSEDLREGVAAFLEKREAKFTGK